MCYIGRHKSMTNALTLNEKMENLKVVTEKLVENGNFDDNIVNFHTVMAKSEIQTYQYPFSRKTKIPNLKEFGDLIKSII